MHLSTDDAHSSQTAHLAADVDVSLNVKRLQELNKYFHAYYVKLNIYLLAIAVQISSKIVHRTTYLPLL